MTSKTVSRPLLAGLIACTAASFTISAQTTTTSSVFEPETTAIVLESKVDPANIKVPASVGGTAAFQQLIGIVSSGLVEFRTRIDTFDPIARTARVTLFLSSPAAAVPTPSGSLPGPTDQFMVSQSVIRFENILQSKGTWSATGHFVNFLGGALPVAPGTIFLTSFGYTYADIIAGGSSTAGFTELSFVIPSAFNLYAGTPAGSITMTAPAGPKAVN